MNEMADYGNEVVEQSMDDLFWSVLRKWRPIIACILVFGLILGGVTFVKQYRTYSDNADKASRQEKYESSLSDYTAKKKSLEASVVNLENRLDFLNHARENSLMLKIDPNNVFRIVTVYYVDSDYQIIPESVYQNPDYTNALVKGYRNAVQRVDYNKLVRMDGEDELFADPPITTQTVKRVYATTIDEEANILTVFIYADKEERANQIMKGVQSAIDEVGETLKTTVGEHSLFKVSNVSEWIVDTDLYKAQSEFQDEYDKVIKKLEEVKSEQTKLSKPLSTVISKKVVIKRALKSGLIGLAIGFIVSVLYFGIKSIMQDRLKSTHELTSRYSLPLLGSLRLGKENRIDGKISSILGLSDLSLEDSIKYIASNINIRVDGLQKLLLTGDIDNDKMDRIAEMLKEELGDREVVIGGSIKKDYSAIQALNDGYGIICVENLQRTKHIDIVNELKTINASKSDMVGFVVVQQ